MKKVQSTILSHIAKSQKRQLVYPVLLLLTSVFLISRTPVFNYIHMDTLNENQVITKKIALHSQYIHAPVTALYYTGNDYWEGKTLRGHFYYALLNGTCQYYVIKARTGLPAAPVLENYTVTGEIQILQDEFDTLSSAMASALNWSAENLKKVSSFYYINETSCLRSREIFFMIILCISFFVSAIITGRIIIYSINPKLTPAYRKLKKYGNPETILSDAERQLKKSVFIQTETLILTKCYLIEFSEDVNAIIPLDSVLWVYDHAAMHLTLHGKTLSYTIHVVTVHGDKYHLKRKSAEDVDMIYDELTAYFPDYFYGYSKEHQQLVNYLISKRKEKQR